MYHRVSLPLLALLAALAQAPFCGPAFALSADEMFADPALEARARDLGRQLRCVKCRNQSIFDSNAGIAQDLRNFVRERIVAGDTDDEILAYVADRFGDYVLLKPRLTGQTYLLWMTPLVMLALGGVAVGGYVRSRTKTFVSSDMSEEERAEAKRILDKEAT